MELIGKMHSVVKFDHINDRLIYLFNQKHIVYKHWPDTCEFITQTIELWNRWIRLSCYYNRV